MLRFARLFTARTIVAAAAVCGAGSILLLRGPSLTAQTQTAVVQEQKETALSLEGAFTHLAETVGPATVSITVPEPPEVKTARAPKTPKPPPDTTFEDMFGSIPTPPRRRERTNIASGSGVIVRADGCILTSDHVVEDALDTGVIVTLQDGTTYRGRVFRDMRSDLALIRITPDKPLPFVRFADSRRVKVGQWAVAIGSPFGQTNTMTCGIVSAVHRKKEISDSGLPRLYLNLIQTDASINPGNSGGPLLNINGELIGINAAIFSPTGTSLGIGYAVPANTAHQVLNQLLDKGRVTRASLGIVPTDIPPGLRKRLQTRSGAYVSEVAPDTGADRAGVLADDVIVRVGTAAIDDEGDLRETVGNLAPGTRVAVTVLRLGKSVTVPITLDAAPEAFQVPPVSPTLPAPVKRTAEELGFEPRPLTPQIAADWEISREVRGVLVADLTPDSPASQAGLTAPALVYAVGGTPVASVDSLREALSLYRSGDTVTLLVYRFGANRTARPGRAAVNIVVP